KSKYDNGNEKLPICAAANHPRHQSQSERGDRGTDDERQSGTKAIEQSAGPVRQASHDDRERKKSSAGKCSRVTANLDKREWQKEKRAAKGAVEEHRQDIYDAECT